MWSILGIPGGSVVNKKQKHCVQCRRCRRCRLNPWVRKIPRRRKMATHCSIFAWRIPWTEEPGELLYRVIVGHS